MSSTPSISSIRRCAILDLGTGAKPTPQLPITTVVTPCQLDGLQARIPGRLAVIVGVDVDEARRDQQALGVDLLAPSAATVPTAAICAVDRDIGGHGRPAPPVGDLAAPDDQIVCHVTMPPLCLTGFS